MYLKEPNYIVQMEWNGMDSFKAVKTHIVFKRNWIFSAAFIVRIRSFQVGWLTIVGAAATSDGTITTTTTTSTTSTTIHIVTVYASISVGIRIQSNTVKAIEVHVSMRNQIATTTKMQLKLQTYNVHVQAYIHIWLFHMLCCTSTQSYAHSCIFFSRAMGFLRAVLLPAMAKYYVVPIKEKKERIELLQGRNSKKLLSFHK